MITGDMITGDMITGDMITCDLLTGDTGRGGFNPTQYRSPAAYFALLQSASIPYQESPQQVYGFELVMAKSVQAYIKVR